MSNVKRKMGRPPIAGEPLDQISIRLTPDELAEATDLAKRKGISRNEAIRMIYNQGRKHADRL